MLWWPSLRCFLCPAWQNVPERSKPASWVWAASTSMAQWASQCESAPCGFKYLEVSSSFPEEGVSKRMCSWIWMVKDVLRQESWFLLWLWTHNHSYLLDLDLFEAGFSLEFVSFVWSKTPIYGRKCLNGKIRSIVRSFAQARVDQRVCSGPRYLQGTSPDCLWAQRWLCQW